MVAVYPRYEAVGAGEPLMQGDLLDACPIVIPPPVPLGTERVEAMVREYDVIVMSQSCDLEQRKVDLVLVCPVWPISEFGQNDSFYGTSDGQEALRRGYCPGYHLVHPCDLVGFERECLVVDFRNIYGVPFDFLLDFAGSIERRLRLLPPYREHLSQAFARFFMRVGLPVDIPPFK